MYLSAGTQQVSASVPIFRFPAPPPFAPCFQLSVPVLPSTLPPISACLSPCYRKLSPYSSLSISQLPQTFPLFQLVYLPVTANFPHSSLSISLLPQTFPPIPACLSLCYRRLSPCFQLIFRPGPSDFPPVSSLSIPLFPQTFPCLLSSVSVPLSSVTGRCADIFMTRGTCPQLYIFKFCSYRHIFYREGGGGGGGGGLPPASYCTILTPLGLGETLLAKTDDGSIGDLANYSPT
jgi:hypothetical protein